jgi:hypothetical protein
LLKKKKRNDARESQREVMNYVLPENLLFVLVLRGAAMKEAADNRHQLGPMCGPKLS